MNITNVIREITKVQKAIKTPLKREQLKGVVSDDPSVPLSVFPVFVNIEVEEDIDNIAQGLREEILMVGMHLIFAAAGSKYSIADRRAWRDNVIDSFEGQNLNGEALRAHIIHIGYRSDDNPLALQSGLYLAASFQLRVVWKGA